MVWLYRFILLKEEKYLLDEYRRTGDLHLLGMVYEPYMSLLYGVCYKYYGKQAESEDAVMQIFEELIDKLRIHEVSNFKSWLYTFARNHCLMDLRKRNRMVMVDMDEGVLTGQDLVSQSDTELFSKQQVEDQLTLMEACLETLSEEQERCVRLFYLEQKCYKDVADITGFEMGKVKSYIQNGKRNLKLCMERRQDEQ